MVERERACDAWGGRLTSITSSTENADVLAVLAESGASQAWIGLNDLVQEGMFAWADGSPPTFLQPLDSNNGPGLDCALFVVAPTSWTMADCSNGYRAVCERHPGIPQ